MTRARIPAADDLTYLFDRLVHGGLSPVHVADGCTVDVPVPARASYRAGCGTALADLETMVGPGYSVWLYGMPGDACVQAVITRANGQYGCPAVAVAVAVER